MKFNFLDKTPLEKFAKKIFFLLVENSEQVFFVGGVVRDLLLENKIQDVDFATDLPPNKVSDILKKNMVAHSVQHATLGTVNVPYRKNNFSVTTFRTEKYNDNRYPSVKFVRDVKVDAQRRDFTINCLYLSPKLKEIIDFYDGVHDIKTKTLRFIGEPLARIQEDPLRILRGVRFALDYNLKMEKNTRKIILENTALLNNITQNRAVAEAGRCRKKINKNILLEIISRKEILDRYAKKF